MVINKALLFTHFEGRTTPLQIELLREWLQNAGNQQQYYTWLQEWERQNPQFIPDSDAAYLKFQQQTSGVAQPTVLRQLPGWNQWNAQAFLLAASVAALVLTATYLTRGYWAMRTIATEYGEVRSVVLPDGSCVTLNANSKLQLPRFSFGTLSPARDVFLTGEAEFAVVHTPTHDHFRVHVADNVEVVVLGTEFVVNTRRNNTRVELNRGKVQLRYPAPNQINTLTMHAGDWVNLSSGGLAKRGRVDAKQLPAATWKNYQYTFQRTPMPDIANLLTDNFGLTVQLDSALARRKVTGTFHAHNADELLQALIALFDIDVIREEKSVQLSAPGSGSIQ